MVSTLSQGTLDELGRLIEDACEKGDSVSAIARRSGVHRNVVSGLRNGSYESNPSLDSIEAIAAAIGMQLIFSQAK